MDLNGALIDILGLISFVSVILVVLEASNFLPDFVLRWVENKRVMNTILTLKKFGVDIDGIAKFNSSRSIPNFFAGDDIETSLKTNFVSYTLGRKVSVGKRSPLPCSNFVDIMGATTDSSNAANFAKLLCSYYGNLKRDNKIQGPDIDFIVTPKSGAPFLGYEFSSLIKKPFVVHLDDDKFHFDHKLKQSEFLQLKFQQKFDAAMKHKDYGKCAMVVDDSATGGRKLISAIQDLRNLGFQVENCLVLFMPEFKNVDEVMGRLGVKLHSITRTHKKEK